MIPSPTHQEIEILVQGKAAYWNHPELQDEYFHIKERDGKYLGVFTHPELGTLESNAHSDSDELTSEILQMRSALKKMDERFSVLDFFLSEGLITEEEFEAAHEPMFSQIEELCAKWSPV